MSDSESERRREDQAREALIEACRRMNAVGLNQGTSGNISVRHEQTMLISPSATPYDELRPEMVAAIPLDRSDGSWSGPLRPSTEWRFHLDIMRSRPEVRAIVHAHPVHCTALAINRQHIPACHYMVAAFGGADIRCAPYATFGTALLSQYAVEALEGRNACLLANHGMIVCGKSIAHAMWLGIELETLARQYVNALTAGTPVLLTEQEIAEAASRFAGYGRQA